jgi:hypothetical protein
MQEVLGSTSSIRREKERKGKERKERKERGRKMVKKSLTMMFCEPNPMPLRSLKNLIGNWF